MDKYRLLPKQKDPQPINEIRVKAAGIIRNYVAYAATLFLEKNQSTVVLKGVGNAIPRIIQLAEIIRRRVKGLHQLSKITSNESTDTYQPLEEGLDIITLTRRLTFFEITLSKNQLDTQNSGYQPPLPDSEVKVLTLEQLRRPQQQRDSQGEGGYRGRSSRGNRRFRGRGQGQGRGQGRGYGRGQGRGYGRGQGQGRGPRSRGPPRGRETSWRGQQ